jgi:hypothetical protein
LRLCLKFIFVVLLLVFIYCRWYFIFNDALCRLSIFLPRGIEVSFNAGRASPWAVELLEPLFAPTLLVLLRPTEAADDEPRGLQEVVIVSVLLLLGGREFLFN